VPLNSTRKPLAPIAFSAILLASIAILLTVNLRWARAHR
jgi:hypothetical protein